MIRVCFRDEGRGFLQYTGTVLEVREQGRLGLAVVLDGARLGRIVHGPRGQILVRDAHGRAWTAVAIETIDVPPAVTA